MNPLHFQSARIRMALVELRRAYDAKQLSRDEFRRQRNEKMTQLRNVYRQKA